MAFQILLNVLLGFMWMVMTVSFEPVAFFKGYLFGLLILYIFRNFFSSRFYLFRILAVLNLTYIFIRELISSNIAVVKTVLKPKLDMKPGIFAYPTILEKNWEITILANLITLTPGTLVIEVSPDNKILYVHALDINDAQESIDSIKNTFEKAILEVGR
ncbi:MULTISPECIES: Na+/H+ antiporter subunit E [unclassified Niallia]|uniref:Na+/H+ antiporter subunit E n=1 Tax=Niallia TaxID=2837506 RepID=UPI001EDC68E0|nr:MULTISPECIES: Na+/H+ antiporter subunit E [unclassified Niallia]MCM3033975.1 Na+/H+ antiporter subunit E [Niallia sp. MER 6]UPO90074.1 Na+/H+ antiporter subunit E [Niallia sp. Man26]